MKTNVGYRGYLSIFRKSGSVQEEVAAGTLTADGTQQVVFGASSLGKYEGYIDLTNMAMGDVVVVREMIRIKEGGDPILHVTSTYNDLQPEPAAHSVRKLIKYGYLVTLEQTAGGFKPFDFNLLRERN